MTMSKLSSSALLAAVVRLRRECIGTPLDAAAQRAHERVVARIKQATAATGGTRNP